MGNRKGLTLVELLVALACLSLLLAASAPGVRAFFARLEMHSALRTVSAALNTARCRAIRDGRPVRAEVVPGGLRLSQEDGPGWRAILDFALGGRVSLQANGRPVFSPLGFASPLCTFVLSRERRVCRIVLSLYGRLKVYGDG